MVCGVALSIKVREPVIKKCYEGDSLLKIASNLNMSKSTVEGIIKNFGGRGSTEVAGKSPTLVTAQNSGLLIKICKSQHLSLRNVTSQWNDEIGLNVSWKCYSKWIHKCGLGFYKVKLK